ncbi:putative plant non-specific lipid-transfer protein/Par allergen [Helianthus annuus]|nr:putative plant lipid transfer protein/Par allergen [Helianthus annuus]KAJ0742574.1 putative plant non-specific lipid-transfer protein/Par allergen [Helianthus annuus]
MHQTYMLNTSKTMASNQFEVFSVAMVMLCLCGVTMAQSGCTTALVSLSPCLGYVSGNSSTPSTSCCSQLANVVQSQPQCLCVFTGDGSGAPPGLNINQTLALALPGACTIQTPPVSRCTEGANGPASSTPSDSPSESGSKTTPGTSAGASSATTISKTLPFYATSVLIFIATIYASY